MAALQYGSACDAISDLDSERDRSSDVRELVSRPISRPDVLAAHTHDHGPDCVTDSPAPFPAYHFCDDMFGHIPSTTCSWGPIPLLLRPIRSVGASRPWCGLDRDLWVPAQSLRPTRALCVRRPVGPADVGSVRTLLARAAACCLLHGIRVRSGVQHAVRTGRVGTIDGTRAS